MLGCFPIKTGNLMRIFFIFFILLTTHLLPSNTVAVTENDPSSLVEGVSVITGDLSSEKEDIAIQGVEPIHLNRNYISQKGKGVWDFFSYHRAYMDWDSKLVELTEPTGAILLYEGTISTESLKEQQDRYGENLEKRGMDYAFALKQSSTKGMANTGKRGSFRSLQR